MGIPMAQKNKNFSEEFKMEIVHLCKEIPGLMSRIQLSEKESLITL
jgi:transposase-like protein